MLQPEFTTYHDKCNNDIKSKFNMRNYIAYLSLDVIMQHSGFDICSYNINNMTSMTVSGYSFNFKRLINLIQDYSFQYDFISSHN